jgi:hypothetical protein
MATLVAGAGPSVPPATVEMMPAADADGATWDTVPACAAPAGEAFQAHAAKTASAAPALRIAAARLFGWPAPVIRPAVMLTPLVRIRRRIQTGEMSATFGDRSIRH